MFKLREVKTEEYAQFVFDSLMTCLGSQQAIEESPVKLQRIG